VSGSGQWSEARGWRLGHAVAILDDWLVDLGDSPLSSYERGVFALYGETQKPKKHSS
jgi:hypothetical protein